MQFKSPSKQILFAIVFLGFVFFLAIVFYFIPKSSIQDSSAILAPNITINSTSKQENSNLAVRLKIPKINVDSPVVPVGLTRLGAMDAPTDPMEVGWFNLGPNPGEVGSAVIDGHSGYKDNIPAIFDDLSQLSLGDDIYIENNKGETIIFVVKKIQKYYPDSDAYGVFNSNDGLAHLNLITCVGVWDTETRSRSERLVIFTDRK
ncbi:hypothetical protein COU49_02365 [Candidatus Nomurabacteria bacterium CG10_big_fil_rev_8_21_14_0_10_35_16]|uniref:Class F sortase n=1 Tax=Candidatus Nomurabacteria bacterium CG10_big_fil_rev_8_21_14_0_10_35_16 TaxID=1974731 RepID=A0A2H0TAW5_9BACT|nr:MAG: hypothetical protein COU49_02365 [Candidatus Nomurabacteria bacterium CG10_big_fil_rev_8_21_14_0_10_35_16]